MANVVKCASITADAQLTTAPMEGKHLGGRVERSTLEPPPPEYTVSHRERYAMSLAAAAKLQAACASVGKVAGALQHMYEGAPLPEHQGLLSTTYTIELVDW
jgi:hypothetical protein